jgi:hypothetical protein
LYQGGRGQPSECSTLQTITFAEGSVLESIGQYAFATTGVTSVDFPASLKTIGNYTFYGSALETITFAEGSVLESIGQYAFATTGVTSVDFPASLKTIGGFSYCRSLETITFAENIENIGNYAFAGTGITSLDFPASLKTIGQHALYAPCTRRGQHAVYAPIRQELVSKALAFRTLQEQRWEQESVAADDTFALGREANDVTRSKTDERLKSPLAAEGFGNVELAFDATLTELRNEIVALIEALSARSPTPEPFAAWRQSNAPEGACPLEGQWMLLFTTGADATFRKTDKQGQATTFTQISAKRGHIVNCVDFSSETAKLQGFRVVVAGFPLSADEVQLKFRRVKLLRRSHWLKTVVIPLPPSRLLRALSRWASRGKGQLSRRGAGFKVLYLDATMRMHLTFDGQYFVQMRPEAFEAAIAAQAS